MKYSDKEKIEHAREFTGELISYLKNMMVLTDDELALLDGANDLIETLNK